MPAILAPALYAVIAWWFTTGVILWLDRLPRRTFPWSMAGATVVLLATGYIVPMNAEDLTPRGAYVGFSCAILIWGWLEMSFLMGFITGPRKQACTACCSGWRRFAHATQAIAYNEVATLIGGAALFLATRPGANHTAFWTYLVLWTMRISAKLNLFLGVPNLGEKFLPPHLQYLKGFFRKRPMNVLFPLSVSGSTVAAAWLLQSYLKNAGAYQAVSNALLFSLLTLAVLEHWFMVLPLPSEKLWTWAMKPKLPRQIAIKSP
jgi:putative photosynthetic complex assembly protein 2